MMWGSISYKEKIDGHDIITMPFASRNSKLYQDDRVSGYQ